MFISRPLGNREGEVGNPATDHGHLTPVVDALDHAGGPQDVGGHALAPLPTGAGSSRAPRAGRWSSRDSSLVTLVACSSLRDDLAVLAGPLTLEIGDQRAQLDEFGVDAAGALLEGLAAQLDLFGTELHAVVEASPGDLDRGVDGGPDREVTIGRHGGSSRAPLGQDRIDRRRHRGLEHLVGLDAHAAAEPPPDRDADRGGAQGNEDEEERKGVRGHGPSMRQGCDSHRDTRPSWATTSARMPWWRGVRGARTTAAHERRDAAPDQD